MGQIYLNGEPVDKLPDHALKIMSERLSKVVSEYFSAHPDEYLRFLEGQKRKKEREAAEASAPPPPPKKTRKRKTAVS